MVPVSPQDLLSPFHGAALAALLLAAVAFVLWLIIFIIYASWMFFRRRDWCTSFLQKLDWLFIPAQHRTVRIIRLRVCLQHFFPIRGKLTVCFGRNHPVLDFSLRHAVFFSVCRIVS